MDYTKYELTVNLTSYYTNHFIYIGTINILLLVGGYKHKLVNFLG